MSSDPYLQYLRIEYLLAGFNSGTPSDVVNSLEHFRNIYGMFEETGAHFSQFMVRNFKIGVF